jgi:hypothetical protein
LNEIVIGNNIKTIEESAFEDLTSLVAIIIPKSVENIGNKAFKGCISLKNLIFETGETTLLLGYNNADIFEIGQSTFSDCPLETIFIGRNLSYESSSNYGYSPFYGISSLKDVSFDNSVVTLSDNLFRNCTNLINVKIPDYMMSIGSSAFYGCSGLTSVIMGNSVNSIGNSAFSNCPQLKDVYCFAVQVPNTGNDIFVNSSVENATLHVPLSALNDYKETEPWKNFKSIVKIDMSKYDLVYIVDGEVYKSYEIEEGKIITPEAAPTKEGYTFSGWSEIPETMPAHDVTVTGRFVLTGDANGNDIVDEADKEEVINYIMGNPSEQIDMVAADANHDGKVNVADIVEITNIIKK